LLDEARQPIYHDVLFTLINGLSERGLVCAWTLEQDWRLVVLNDTDRPVHLAIPLPERLFPASLLPAQEVFSGASLVLGEQRQQGALHPDLPPFGVQMWRPRREPISLL
jgi:hypothetical protein